MKLHFEAQVKITIQSPALRSHTQILSVIPYQCYLSVNLPDRSIRGGRQKSLVISGPAEIIDYFQMTAEGSQNLARGNIIHWNSKPRLVFTRYVFFRACLNIAYAWGHSQWCLWVLCANNILIGWRFMLSSQEEQPQGRCSLPTTGNESLSAQAAASIVPAWEKSTVKQPIWPPRNASMGLLGIRQTFSRETLIRLV